MMSQMLFTAALTDCGLVEVFALPFGFLTDVSQVASAQVELCCKKGRGLVFCRERAQPDGAEAARRPAAEDGDARNPRVTVLTGGTAVALFRGVEHSVRDRA